MTFRITHFDMHGRRRRKLLNDLISDAAAEAGVSYQPELQGV